MQIGFRNKLFSNLPAMVPQPEEIWLDVAIYVALRPNHAGNIIYEKGAGGLRKVMNYAEVYRWADVLRKVLSRQVSEQVRNDKWLACGLGRDKEGSWRYFIHPAAQCFQSEITVPACWTQETTAVDLPGRQWALCNDSAPHQAVLDALAAQWLPVSGQPSFAPAGIMDAVADIVTRTMPALRPVASVFSEVPAPKVQVPKLNDQQAGAVLFGYGNYARTITLPFLKPFVQLQKVHEVDPALLAGCTLPASTNPLPDEGDDQYPVWLIAGFHHTHAGLALRALEKGIIPVIEKPVATTLAELEALERTARHSGTPFFQCFQKRYQVFNTYTFEDLQVQPGDPIHYKAVVYEIPLHPRHWYNWPASGSRIISNGCHWIDQFMFLNGYASCLEAEVQRLNDYELLLTLHLENGATGVITLSDIGVNRIGMREYIELSVKGRRCTIIDSMHYRSESDSRILRSRNTDKLHYLRMMYSSIGRAIVHKAGGDRIESLRSSFVTLALEEKLKRMRP